MEENNGYKVINFTLNDNEYHGFIKVTKKHLARLQRNVPLQEVGRFTNSEIVLSRANKSLRLFQKVVDSLANGKQPSLIDINSVGYLSIK